MNVAIMQPYFLPYIGYFQLIALVDKFVIYDDIKYTKKGWINRNRFLAGGRDAVFSLPLKKDSDALDVRNRFISPAFNRARVMNRFREAYRHAPCFGATYPLLERIMALREDNLFSFIHSTLVMVCSHLGIKTPLVISSSLEVDRSVSGEGRVIEICKRLGARNYINPVGGKDLYSRDYFLDQGIELRLMQSRLIEYPQFGLPFIPWLSIVDVMMFQTVDAINRDLIPACDVY